MEAILALGVTLWILWIGIAAIRRDPRFDLREIVTQLLLFAAYLALAVAVVLLAQRWTAGLGEWQPAVVVSIALLWIGASVVVLALYLRRRLERLKP